MFLHGVPVRASNDGKNANCRCECVAAPETPHADGSTKECAAEWTEEARDADAEDEADEVEEDEAVADEAEAVADEADEAGA